MVISKYNTIAVLENKAESWIEPYSYFLESRTPRAIGTLAIRYINGPYIAATMAYSGLASVITAKLIVRVPF